MAWTTDWDDEEDALQDNEFWGFAKACGNSGYTVTALYGSASLDTADSQPVSATVLLEMLEEYLNSSWEKSEYMSDSQLSTSLNLGRASDPDWEKSDIAMAELDPRLNSGG